MEPKILIFCMNIRHLRLWIKKDDDEKGTAGRKPRGWRRDGLERKVKAEEEEKNSENKVPKFSKLWAISWWNHHCRTWSNSNDQGQSWHIQIRLLLPSSRRTYDIAGQPRTLLYFFLNLLTHDRIQLVRRLVRLQPLYCTLSLACWLL